MPRLCPIPTHFHIYVRYFAFSWPSHSEQREITTCSGKKFGIRCLARDPCMPRQSGVPLRWTSRRGSVELPVSTYPLRVRALEIMERLPQSGNGNFTNLPQRKGNIPTGSFHSHPYRSLHSSRLTDKSPQTIRLLSPIVSRPENNHPQCVMVEAMTDFLSNYT